MPRLYVLREPTGEKEWDIYCLREAARLKKWLLGVYYSPRHGRLFAVFKPPPGTHVNMLVFEEAPPRLLENSYRMVCMPGCGRCCVAHSGAFILDVELRDMPYKYRSMVEMQPSELVRTPGGPVRVYRLGTGSLGRCIFFDESKAGCMIEEYKPIICRLTYCTVFAEKNGKIYLKVAGRVRGSRAEMIYREASPEEVRAAVQRMASMLRKYRRALRLAMLRGEELETPTTGGLRGERRSLRGEAGGGAHG